MISKKISDLKDINFEISTALQLEPSLYHLSIIGALVLAEVSHHCQVEQ